MGVGRPKTVAILREIAIGHGEAALRKLAAYAERDDDGDARMAAVIERACEAILDRVGLTPKAAELVKVTVNGSEVTAETKTEDLEAGLGPSGVIQ